MPLRATRKPQATDTGNRGMEAKTALITGITGQDGSYLAELLLEKGYRVFGLVRQPTGESVRRISHLRERVQFLTGDLLNEASLFAAVRIAQPDEVYNLAAMSYVPHTWNQQVLNAELTAVGVTRLLEAIRQEWPKARFFQASSSEMFGRVTETPQRETTRFNPRSPYGVAKVYAHLITANYRDSFSLFASSGILFNHESPRRGPEFVTRKITQGVARIKKGLVDELRLGNLQARRDWGFAGDYVQAMWLMLQQDEPEDFVIGTGTAHSVEDFVRLAFAHAGLDWQKYVVSDSEVARPLDLEILRADPTKARQQLGWEPRVGFEDLVRRMVDADLVALGLCDADENTLGAQQQEAGRARSYC
jgi:GDPmannose 4,6-dehydratase